MLHEKSLGSVRIISVDHESLIHTLKEKSISIKADHPEIIKILLFGSFSKGNFLPESDIDILLIIEATDIPFLERKERFRPFFRDIPFDVNILVYTKSEIDLMHENGNLFIKDIFKEAIDLI